MTSAVDDVQQASAGPRPAPAADEPAEFLPGVASLPPLVAAFRRQDPAALRQAREAFEACNGRILSCHVTETIEACAVLVLEPEHAAPWRARPRRRLMVLIDRRDLAMRVPSFLSALWRTLWLARRAEGAAGSAITAQTRLLVADMLFTVAVFLLGALEVAAAADDAGREPLATAAALAKRELDRIERYLERAAIHKTFRHYLFGLPAGILLLGGLVVLLRRIPGLPGDVRSLATMCVAGGSIGAVTSVMVRITRGQRLSVDIHQGSAVAFFAGAFRPLVGAVFGTALYVLVIGGLLPLDTDPNVAHFFGGLSFLAGFSERWAQDTIVRSAPIAPSPATAATAGARPEAPREGRSPDWDDDTDK